MQSTLEITNQLLLAEKNKATHTYGRVKIFPLIAACLNLFLCGLFDQYLREDVNGHYLTLFFLIQSIVCISFAIGNYNQSSAEILSKTKIFPVSFGSRLLFILKSNIRHGLFISLITTSILFFIVFYHRQPVVMFFAIFSYALLLVVVEVVVACLLLIAQKSIRTIMSVAIFVFITAFIISIFALIFHFNTPLLYTPLVSWTSSSILAMQRYDYLNVLLNVSFFILTLIIALFVGKRYS